MDSKNNDIEESEFSDVSTSAGVCPLQMAEKFKDVMMKMINDTKNGDQLEKKIDGLKKENSELKDGMTKLMKELDELKQKMTKNEEFDGKNNEVKEVTNFEQFDGIQWVNYDRNEYKLVFGSKMSINGLMAEHFGPPCPWVWNCVRTNLPIPSFNSGIQKPTIAFYFEVHILKKPLLWYDGIVIGFCTENFPLEGKWLGSVENSIGMWRKGGMRIDGKFNFPIKGLFNKGDVIGLGIIHWPNSTMECFATCDGKFLEKNVLPPKFAGLKLFPAINLNRIGHTIRVNFGNDEWQFKDFGRVFE